jgi:hypothetical protein
MRHESSPVKITSATVTGPTRTGCSSHHLLLHHPSPRTRARECCDDESTLAEIFDWLEDTSDANMEGPKASKVVMGARTFPTSSDLATSPVEASERS